MENIFAKPPASPSHHYALLLQKKEISTQNFKDQFSTKMPSPVHLYSTLGLAKVHRKTTSSQKYSPDPQPCEAFTEPVRSIKEERLAVNVLQENEWLKSQLEIEKKKNSVFQKKIQDLELELTSEREKLSKITNKPK